MMTTACDKHCYQFAVAENELRQTGKNFKSKLKSEYLKSEVAECFVGFSHAVNFIPLFHGAASAFGGFHQLIG